MDIDLTYEQTAQLELIAMHAGKPTAQLLVETAQFLFAQDAADSQPRPDNQIQFITKAELDARLTRILRP